MFAEEIWLLWSNLRIYDSFSVILKYYTDIPNLETLLHRFSNLAFEDQFTAELRSSDPNKIHLNRLNKIFTINRKLHEGEFDWGWS